MALLVQKLWTKKLSESVSGYFKTKKVLLTSKPRGGGLKSPVYCPLKKEFLRLPAGRLRKMKKNILKLKEFQNQPSIHNFCEIIFFPCKIKIWTGKCPNFRQSVQTTLLLETLFNSSTSFISISNQCTVSSLYWFSFILGAYSKI